jgi:hypothetical protein
MLTRQPLASTYLMDVSICLECLHTRIRGIHSNIAILLTYTRTAVKAPSGPTSVVD